VGKGISITRRKSPAKKEAKEREHHSRERGSNVGPGVLIKTLREKLIRYDLSRHPYKEGRDKRPTRPSD